MKVRNWTSVPNAAGSVLKVRKKGTEKETETAVFYQKYNLREMSEREKRYERKVFLITLLSCLPASIFYN
jgi:hypothetical protein